MTGEAVWAIIGVGAVPSVPGSSRGRRSRRADEHADASVACHLRVAGQGLDVRPLSLSRPRRPRTGSFPTRRWGPCANSARGRRGRRHRGVRAHRRRPRSPSTPSLPRARSTTPGRSGRAAWAASPNFAIGAGATGSGYPHAPPIRCRRPDRGGSDEHVHPDADDRCRAWRLGSITRARACPRRRDHAIAIQVIVPSVVTSRDR
jgi:hypothetical protein